MSTAAAVLAVLLGAGAPAQEPADAEGIVEAINSAYEAGDYARAIELIEEAYARDPRPAYLYSKGEILIAAGDCERAIEAFEAFLGTQPPAVDAAAAREKIDRCRPQVDAEPPPPEAAPAPAPAPGPDRPRAVARDPAFIALTTVGAALAVTGASLLVGARVTADRTGSAATEDAWESDITRVRGLAIGGAVIVGVGGSLLLGAVARAIVLRSR